MTEASKTTPFVKWAGGKRKIIPRMRFPKEFNTYYEPFAGGAAVLFYLQPESALISDINNELINTYDVVSNNVESLISALKQMKPSKEYYLYLRNLDRHPDDFMALGTVGRAARFIFLNKMCFNGLYRENKKGQFNVPFSGKEKFTFDEEALRAASDYLYCHVTIGYSSDFNEALLREDWKISYRDFVYLDPPYAPVSDISFTGYNKTGFSLNDHYRLKEDCDLMTSCGTYFLQSNADTPFIRELYNNYEIQTIQAPRNINANGKGRGFVNELLIYNY